MLEDNNVDPQRGGSNLCLFKNAEVHGRLVRARQIGPGVAILTMVLGFNLLGDGMRDALDPKTKED